MKKKTNKKSEWIIEGLIKKGAVNIMNVAHDDWCDMLKNRDKECNCNPDVKVSVMEENKK